MKKANLVFMHGDDNFSMQAELQRWKSAFIQKHGDSNLEEFDGAKVDLSLLRGSLSALPFLGEKRLVILKNFIRDNKADVAKKALPLLDALADTTVFVMTELGSPDKRGALYKKLVQEATVRIFNPPQGAQLSTWIIRRAQTHGGKIDNRSANYLAGLVGQDLFRLENEVQKLSLYAGERAINPELIDEMVSGQIEQSIFTLTDQLAHKNISGALRTMRMLQEQGHEAPFLFAMITRQFRLMLEMKVLGESGMGQPAIAREMKVHPFVVKKTMGHCRNFTTGQLKKGLRELLEIDRRLKTGNIHLRPREEEQYLLAIERVLL